MVVAKAGIGLIEKIAPKAVAAIGKASAQELILAGGLVGGVANSVIDHTVVPAIKKLGELAKTKFDAATENKKQELLDKRAATLEAMAQKAKAEAENVEVQTEEVKAETVEEKPNKGSKKKNK